MKIYSMCSFLSLPHTSLLFFSCSVCFSSLGFLMYLALIWYQGSNNHHLHLSSSSSSGSPGSFFVFPMLFSYGWSKKPSLLEPISVNVVYPIFRQSDGPDTKYHYFASQWEQLYDMGKICQPLFLWKIKNGLSEW